MVNKHYVKGRRKEYKIVNELKAEGYEIVQRSAGSHSPVDIFAIHKELKIMKFIQAKPNDYKDSQVKKLLKENDWLNGTFKCEFLVV